MKTKTNGKDKKFSVVVSTTLSMVMLFQTQSKKHFPTIRWLMPVLGQLPLIFSPGLHDHISKTQRAEPAQRNSLSSPTSGLGLCIADE